MYHNSFCFTWVLRRPWPSSRLPWSCSWSPLSFVELDLNSEDRLTKTTLAASGKSTTGAHRQFFCCQFSNWFFYSLAVCIIYTMEEKVSQSRLLSWQKKSKQNNMRRKVGHQNKLWLLIIQARGGKFSRKPVWPSLKRHSHHHWRRTGIILLAEYQAE